MPDALLSPFVSPTTQILGISFYTGEADQLVQQADALGLVVVPSAPVLVAMDQDESHRIAVQSADVAIADSGWMVLLWFAITGNTLPRISGLRFLQMVLQTPSFRRRGASFWVMPTVKDSAANRAWLLSQGIEVAAPECYEAPLYPVGALKDEELLRRIEASRAPFVVICLAGGVQERLGHFLRQRLSYRPTIICIGAAIAFLSGQQVAIPTWADRLFLGWLFRTLSNPRQYFPRYWRSLRLAPLLVQFRDQPPRK